MTQSIFGKNTKFLLSALLACALTAGLALNVGAADESPADVPEAATALQPAAPPAPNAARRHGPGDFAKKHAKFLEDTRELRRRIAVAEGAMQAVLHSAQPDVNLAQRFAGELFDLREQMRAKAAENGLPPMMGGKMGHPCRGFMGHGGPRHGMFPGDGRGHGGAPMMERMGRGGHHGHMDRMDCGCGGR